MPTFHALLIGINHYEGRVPSLSGCINDIDAIQKILLQELAVEPERIVRLTSPHVATPRESGVQERLADLENIQAELQRLGTEAVAQGDSVFIYYSGHGTNKSFPGRNGTLYRREALVPSDYGRTKRLLFDWKLNEWLSAIASRTNAVTVVLDACCSSGITRILERPKSASRYINAREVAALDDEEAPEPGVARGLAFGLSGTVETCQVVAACLGDERAQESEDWDDICHGDLTRALVAELRGLDSGTIAGARWGRIWPGITARVRRTSPGQTPWISESYSRRRVFGGPPEHGDLGFSVTAEGKRYRLHVGELSGITAGAELAVYGFEPAKLPPIGSDEDRELKPHTIVVESAEPATAIAVAKQETFELPAGARARLVRAGSPAQLRVAVEPRDEEVERQLDASGLIAVVDPSDLHDLLVIRLEDGSWTLTDSVFGPWGAPGEPWLVRVPEGRRRELLAVIEHYHHYVQPLRFAQRCNDLSGRLRVSILDASSPLNVAKAQDIDQFMERTRSGNSYDIHAAENPAGVPICIGARNGSGMDLMVTIVIANNSGRVSVMSPTLIPAAGGHVFWAGATVGKPIKVTPLDGRRVSLDRIIGIGTTDRSSSSMDYLRRKSSFESILLPTRSKEVDLDEEPVPMRFQWVSDVVTLRVLAPGSP